MPTAGPHSLAAGLLAAGEGSGPLLQRDYWVRIARCRVRPTELIGDLVGRFQEFAPEELVRFERESAPPGPLRVGEELVVRVRVAGECRVRVVCLDSQSFTLATLPGHPEAGRITFGAYRDDRGQVIFHIRSRARASSELRYLGWLVAGEPMQTNTWVDFVEAVAGTFGEGVAGAVHAETTSLDEDEPAGALCTPTFRAEGD